MRIQQHIAHFWVSILLLLLLLEAGARFVLPQTVKLWTLIDERNVFYRYDRDLGWFPLENSSGVQKGEAEVSIRHNSLGFRDVEHDLQRPGAHILLLGDSFVWGSDVEQNKRVSDVLQVLLPAVDIFNLGVSGYGTAQEYLLLQKYFEKLKPQLVFLMFNGENDPDDNSSNCYNGYYKPYYVIQSSGAESGLQLKGVPVRKSVKYYFSSFSSILERSMILRIAARSLALLDMHFARRKVPDITLPLLQAAKKFTQGRSAVFVLGIAAVSPAAAELCREPDSLCVDLENAPRFPSFGNHWTEEGNQLVAEKIFAFFQDKEILREKIGGS